MYGQQAYMRGLPASTPTPAQQLQASAPANDACGLFNQSQQDRNQWIQFLLQFGEMFWLPVSLGLGTTPAAGTQRSSNTNPQDFPLLIVGAASDLKLSSITITDSARNRALTNGFVLIDAIADLTASTATTVFRNNWFRPYLLPARSQLNLTVSADGTESNGNFTFYCLQPPAGMN